METMGVRGIWGLEQLERTGISTWKCALILITALTAFNYLVLGLEFGVLAAPLFGAIEGVYLLAVVVLSRATQKDLEHLLPFDDAVRVSISMLKPTKKTLLAWFLLALTASWVTTATGLAGSDGQGYVEFHQEFVMGGTRQFAFWYVVGPLYALTFAAILATVFTQAKALRHAGRLIEIDILRLDRYPHLASPLIRVISVMLIIVSLFLVFLFYADADGVRVLLVGMPLMALLALTLTGLYAYPIWVLKDRIREAKQKEVHRILAALTGDGEAMARSRISETSGLTITELLAYRDFVESLWDWPLAPHIQRAVLFGLLPPLTWVAAGMVETAVGAISGLN